MLGQLVFMPSRAASIISPAAATSIPAGIRSGADRGSSTALTAVEVAISAAIIGRNARPVVTGE